MSRARQRPVGNCCLPHWAARVAQQLPPARGPVFHSRVTKYLLPYKTHPISHQLGPFRQYLPSLIVAIHIVAESVRQTHFTQLISVVGDLRGSCRERASKTVHRHIRPQTLQRLIQHRRADREDAIVEPFQLRQERERPRGAARHAPSGSSYAQAGGSRSCRQSRPRSTWP